MATNNDLNTGVTPIPMSSGGLGISAMTPYAPLCGGSSSLQCVISAGAIGQYLTSNGSALPSYQDFPSLGGANIIYVKTAVSSAEMLDMRTNPKILVAAYGANTFLMVHQAYFEFNYNSVAYTGGGTVHIQYDSTTSGAGVKATTGISATTVTGLADALTTMVRSTTSTYATATTINKGLYLSNITTAYLTGNSTCNIHLYYSVLSTVV